jgi:hypothetical protein
MARHCKTNEGALVADFCCVRKGTRVLALTDSPVATPLDTPVNGWKKTTALTNRAGESNALGNGEALSSLPVDGEGRGGVSSLNGEVWGGAISLPIESIPPGDFVLGHNGKPNRVVRAIHTTGKRLIGLVSQCQYKHGYISLRETGDM